MIDDTRPDSFTWPCGCVSPAAGGDVTTPCTDCGDASVAGLGPVEMQEQLKS